MYKQIRVFFIPKYKMILQNKHFAKLYFQRPNLHVHGTSCLRWLALYVTGSMVANIFFYPKNLLFFRLSSEYEEDIEAQLFELKNKYDQEKFQLEEALTELEPYVRDLETKNTDLQTKLERQKDEMEKKLKQQKTEMEDLFSRHMQSVEDVEKKKIDMELKYKKQISDLELTFRQERLELESEFEKQVQDVRELQKQKVSLELELKQQRDELELSFRQEKQEIQQLYEERIREETKAQKHLDTEQLQGVNINSLVNILIKWASTSENR